jgi:membrane protein
VFSLGPLLLIVTAVAGIFFGADAVRGSITSQFRSMLGDTGSQAVEAMLKGAESSTAGGWTAAFGIALLIVAAVGVVVQLREALNTIFEAPEPREAGIACYAKVYGMSFAGILALGFLLAVALVVSAGLAAFSTWLSGSAVETLFLAGLNFAVSLAVLTFLFSALFKWLPDRQLSWREVAIGGVVTALLFNIGKTAIAWYIGRQGLESTYGAAASIVVLLIWVYYSSQIVLFGAEITQAYAGSGKEKVRTIRTSGGGP